MTTTPKGNRDADAALFGNRFATQEVPTREFPDDGHDGRGRLPPRRARRWHSRVIRPGTWRRSSRPGWSRRRSGSSPRTCTGTSSTTRSTRAPPRSSSAASGCSPTSSTRRARRPARVPRAPPRRSCWVVSRSSGTGGNAGARLLGRRTPTSSSAATCTWSGRSSAATSTSNPGSCRSGPASTRSAPTTWQPHVDENTIGVAAVLGTTFTGHKDDIVGINDLLLQIKSERGLDVPLHVDGASGGFVWPFLYPDSRVGLPPRAGPLDQRLRAQVRPRLSGHRLADLPGEGRPGQGPRLRGELSRQDRLDVHPQLLHRLGDGAGPVLQPRPLRPRRLHATS